jgi:hypothetical protein
MLELLANIMDGVTQTSIIFYITLWVVLLAINYAYYSK